MMSRRMRHALTGLVLALAAGGCEPAAEPPPTGQILFLRHCASCHGPEGRGDGPLAASLKRPPADLTSLARTAGGHFDEATVIRVIDGRRSVAEHGPRDMPVWGVVFEEELEEERHGRFAAMLHVRALADYVRSIQAED